VNEEENIAQRSFETGILFFRILNNELGAQTETQRWGVTVQTAAAAIVGWRRESFADESRRMRLNE
jgi:hypothetical protein